MAEMTASEAIAVLHNNQYQKHIGNGEYDYIHPLTDAECKGIESLIQQQQQQIEAMKCCGNCSNSQFCVGGHYQLPCLKCVYERRYVIKNKYDKCEHWAWKVVR